MVSVSPLAHAKSWQTRRKARTTPRRTTNLFAISKPLVELLNYSLGMRIEEIWHLSCTVFIKATKQRMHGCLHVTIVELPKVSTLISATGTVSSY